MGVLLCGGEMIPDNHKRYILSDGLGYYRSYDTHRRAVQAAKDIGVPVGMCWIIRDTWDNSETRFLPAKMTRDYEPK